MSKTIEDLIAIAYPHGNAPAFEYSDRCREDFSHVAALVRKECERLTKDLERQRVNLAYQDGRPFHDRRELVESGIEKTEAAISALETQIKACEDLAALATQPEGTTLEQLYEHRAAQAAEFAAREEERLRVYEERVKAEEEVEAREALRRNNRNYAGF